MANKSNGNDLLNLVVDEVDNETKQVEIKKERRKSTEADAAQEMLKRETAQRTLAQFYANQKKLPVRIAPSYAKYFGNIMRVVVNGVAVAIPCNGQTYNIPVEFACECERRMREMDAYELKTRKLADVAKNYEPDIGHLSFF